jgi:para-nitrobenzyl esterase
MAAALLAFARGGVPVSPTVGRWPAFDATSPRLVWLAPESRVIGWPHFGDIGLFENAATSQRPAPTRPRD